MQEGLLGAGDTDILVQGFSGTALWPMSSFPWSRPLHNTGDGRVVPGGLFFHGAACEAGLR